MRNQKRLIEHYEHVLRFFRQLISVLSVYFALLIKTILKNKKTM